MLSACLYGAVMALGFWLPYRAHFAIARCWARLLFRVLERLCGLSFTVEGRESIPPGNHIVMSNHTSAWETVAQFLLFPAAGVGAETRAAVDTLRRLGAEAVAAHRHQSRRRASCGQPSDRAGPGAAHDGLWIIIFPEGTRVAAGETRKFGVSGALLAVASGKASCR